ncbi:hypothetical protein TNCV_1345071 [Trichonephila clavipes]|nr:hypothetical protein TNCV_1345071 [Trichonephila clavipes]
MWVRLGSTDLMAGKVVFLRGLLSPIRVVDLTAVILAHDEGGVETSWKGAGGRDAGTAIGNAGAQMLVKLLEFETVGVRSRVCVGVALWLLAISVFLFGVKYVPPTKVTCDV